MFVGQNAVIDISVFINTYSYVDFCYKYDVNEIMVRQFSKLNNISDTRLLLCSIL